MTASAALPEPAAAGRPVLSAVLAAREALSDCSPLRVWALSEAEVTRTMTVLGELASSVSALTVAMVAEAKTRSLGAGDGWGPVDWARACAPLLPLRELTDAEVVAGAAGDLRLASVVAAVMEGAQPGLVDDSAEGAGVLPVGKAAQIIRFHKSIRGMSDPDVLEGATQILLESARGTAGLSEKELGAAVRHAGLVMRPDRLNDDEDRVKRAHRSLIKSKGPMGLSRYTWLLDEEAAAIVDAAVDALAKPKPDEDTGEHDTRAPETRRADALVDLVIRAVGAPDGVPRQSKATLLVTMGLDVLEGRCRGAGLTASGDVLSADTVRRMACDAQLVPVVLGSRGEVLDQGEAIRLFNRAQVRHLWLRDKHCTFPGCSKPAAWTDAHHLLHWSHGGPTDVWNAALLCRAHHTVVHNQRYAGRVVEGSDGPFVEWDLTSGSYDVMLAARRARFLGDRAPDGLHLGGVSRDDAHCGAAGAGGGLDPAAAGGTIDVGAYREWVAQAWPFRAPEPDPGSGWGHRPRGTFWGGRPLAGARDSRPVSHEGWTGVPTTTASRRSGGFRQPDGSDRTAGAGNCKERGGSRSNQSGPPQP